MGVPLVFGGRIIGCLGFGSKTPNVYGDDDFPLAQRIADQIAGAIANAELHAKLRREENENAVIAEIGRIISSSLALEEVYELFSREARKLIPFDRLSVALEDEATGMETRIAYVHEEGVATIPKGFTFPSAGNLNEIVKQTGRALFLDLDSAEMVAQKYPTLVMAYKAGVRSVLQVPLFSKGAMIGGMGFRSKTPFAYGDEHIRLATRIGNQIAGAIASARLYDELRKAHHTLDQRVKERTVELEETNTALRVLLARREDLRDRVAEDLRSNFSELIAPFLSRLKASGSAEERLACVAVLESNLNNIVSPFINRLSSAHKDLTPKEIQISEMVKQGRNSKEIDELLGIAVGTVVTHRHNIRKKLALGGKSENLRSHLLSITRDPFADDI